MEDSTSSLVQVRAKGEGCLSRDQFDEADECYHRALQLCGTGDDLLLAMFDLLRVDFFREIGADHFHLPLTTERAFTYIQRVSVLLDGAKSRELIRKMLYLVSVFYLVSYRKRELMIQVLEEAFSYGCPWAGVDLALHRHRHHHGRHGRRHITSVFQEKADKETKWILRQSLRMGCRGRKSKKNLVAALLIGRVKRYGLAICPVDLATVRLWADLDQPLQ